ncbi:hypothetical protein HYDPIDRAFT_107714 [Hydnomerulius pinastri MD-312]|nr:hypothetical protein HYDPIDRAFT_107714 [Hydnomerulius pinastri MD-312]
MSARRIPRRDSQISSRDKIHRKLAPAGVLSCGRTALGSFACHIEEGEWREREQKKRERGSEIVVHGTLVLVNLFAKAISDRNNQLVQ